MWALRGLRPLFNRWMARRMRRENCDLEPEAANLAICLSEILGLVSVAFMSSSIVILLAVSNLVGGIELRESSEPSLQLLASSSVDEQTSAVPKLSSGPPRKKGKHRCRSLGTSRRLEYIFQNLRFCVGYSLFRSNMTYIMLYVRCSLPNRLFCAIKN